MNSPTRPPLAGLRIVDLSTVIFGPFASQTLADYGADVIKVEHPEGESTRFTGPAPERGLSAIFMGANRNKRSLALDLKRSEARAALLALIDTADVFMHSMRPQKLLALGLDSRSLLARRPSLIYANLVGFASDGPYAGRPAYDDIVQGLSGNADLMSRTGGAPAYFPMVAADKVSSLVAVHGIMAALLRRARDGVGGVVEIPMFEATSAFNLVEHWYGGTWERSPGPVGYPRALARWRRPLATRDGFVCMLPYTDAQWLRFFTECGEPALARDPRFANIEARTANVEALYAEAGRLAATRSTQAWLDACERLEIPCAPMNRLEDLPSDPHLSATGFFESHHEPGLGTLTMPGFPVTLDGERMRLQRAPRLGEHTRTILSEAGLDAGAIDALTASGAALQASAPTAPESNFSKETDHG
ncbi:MAG: CoA transferase [Burkholderiaceae bacterium]